MLSQPFRGVFGSVRAAIVVALPPLAITFYGWQSQPDFSEAQILPRPQRVVVVALEVPVVLAAGGEVVVLDVPVVVPVLVAPVEVVVDWPLTKPCSASSV